MPDDSGGIYTVPAGTIVSTGDTLLPSQHNPWAIDNATAVSARFSKDGRAPATGDWNLNTFRITNLGTPTGANDATNKTYVDNAISTQGFLFGLTLSNNAVDAVNDIDITAGAAGADTTPFFTMRLASAFTKRLDAAWAVGTNQGGRLSGALADGNFHVWLIQRSDTGVVDIGFDTSATAPTMPTNYDRKRRIGCVIRSGGTILAFTQIGRNKIILTVPFTARNSTAALASSLITFAVPSGVQVEPLISVVPGINVNSNVTTRFGSASTGLATTDVNVLSSTAASSSFSVIEGGFLSNTSQQIYMAVIIPSGTASQHITLNYGWIDTYL